MARVSNEPIKVKMKVSRRVSTDGFTIVSFVEGQTYTLAPALAKELVGSYEIVKEETKVPAGIKGKDAGKAPDNKLAKPEENK